METDKWYRILQTTPLKPRVPVFGFLVSDYTNIKNKE